MEDLIKRSDAIKGKKAQTLNANAEFMMGRFCNEDESRIYNIGFAEGWNAHIERCKDIPSAEKQGEWIPCSERLPEHDIPKTIQEAHTGIKYLVTLSTGTVLITKWKFYVQGRDEHGLKGSWQWGHQFRHQIIAWQPLPEPYMKGADDDAD